ncbi:MAG: serine/threonine protein kinase [Spirochaetales bacterium]|nr:serine/threonine protein kinase [Spirochaetales bacterium]
MENSFGDFEELTPEVIFEAIEAVTQHELEALLLPLPSYINRVYEVQNIEGQHLIAKFYRPGRWTLKAIQQEHRFIKECADAEIPVVAPLKLSNQSTLAKIENYLFALYPKKQGRDLNLEDPEIWHRLGSLLGRVHNVGKQQKADQRLRLHPELSFQQDVKKLLASPVLDSPWRERFESVCTSIFLLIHRLFDEFPVHRLHGDCHSGNILSRDDQGLLLIDFDDMCIGPAVQDIWLLMPGTQEDSREFLKSFLSGYEDFCPFNHQELVLIEPLRAMRMVYFLSWCARQVEDPGFFQRFPQWQDNNFWAREIEDLFEQKERIEKALGYY